VTDQSNPARPWSPAPARKGPTAQATELKDMVVAYARQETVDPLKTLGRYLGFGIGGAILIGTGWVFGLLALLRALQQLTFFNEPGEIDGGRWGWLAYVITALVGIGVAAVYGRLVMLRYNDPGPHAEAPTQMGGF
jgi:hypothetical protein